LLSFRSGICRDIDVARMSAKQINDNRRQGIDDKRNAVAHIDSPLPGAVYICRASTMKKQSSVRQPSRVGARRGGYLTITVLREKAYAFVQTCLRAALFAGSNMACATRRHRDILAARNSRQRRIASAYGVRIKEKKQQRSVVAKSEAGGRRGRMKLV
jgi:hypothetical protein